MRIIEVALFQFDELEEKSKQRAISDYRHADPDPDWYEHILSDFEQICELIGVKLATMPIKLMGGGYREKSKVWFSGFSSQGDGASFEGTYRYRKGSLQAVRGWAPQGTTLRGIAKRLEQIQRRHRYQLSAVVTTSGRYCHEYSMTVDAFSDGDDLPWTVGEDVAEVMRDLARWLYKALEGEWDHRNSDDYIAEHLVANAIEFTANGCAA